MHRSKFLTQNALLDVRRNAHPQTRFIPKSSYGGLLVQSSTENPKVARQHVPEPWVGQGYTKGCPSIRGPQADSRFDRCAYRSDHVSTSERLGNPDHCAQSSRLRGNSIRETQRHHDRGPSRASDGPGFFSALVTFYGHQD